MYGKATRKNLDDNLEKTRKRPINSSVNTLGANKLIRLLIKSAKNLVHIMIKSNRKDSIELKCWTSNGANKKSTPQTISAIINSLIHNDIENFKLRIPDIKEAEISTAEMIAILK